MKAMPVISATVMSHPSRVAAAWRVCDRLAPMASGLVTDPEPDGPPATVRTARLVYATVAAGATHHLVVQDDIEVPDGFAATLRDAVAAQPDAAVSLFVEWGSRTAALVRLAAFTGAGWVPNLNPYVPTQALVLPAEVAREFARYLTTEVPDEEPDDEAAWRFLRRAGVPVLVCVPNLVEHLDLPSLTGNTPHGLRRSACPPPQPPVRIGAAVLELPERLPFLAWLTGTSVILAIVDGEVVDRRPTLAVMAERGHDPSTLTAAYAEVGCTVDDRCFDLWLTAAATGGLLRERWPAAASLDALASPIAARAWRTMAPGGLRRFVDAQLLAGRAEELWRVSEHGLRYGLTHLTSAGR